MKYIHKNQVINAEFANYPQYQFEDRFNNFVALNEEQSQFHTNNPTASVQEIWDCQLTTIVEAIQPTNEELREQAYRAEADQYLIAYNGYLLEGKSTDAEEQRLLYLAKKAEIRERFPIEE